MKKKRDLWLTFGLYIILMLSVLMVNPVDSALCEYAYCAAHRRTLVG